ncbi:MAG: hypothetical protein M1828_005702 [Chrysothrix sp. TS-e1954]|nr:MAG: hypothetical protein M1828_005702 [Chrysothrix sp. TS-e1954]
MPNVSLDVEQALHSDEKWKSISDVSTLAPCSEISFNSIGETLATDDRECTRDDCERPLDSSREALGQTYDEKAILADCMPPKRGSRVYRNLRSTVFTFYRILFSIVFCANLASLIALCCRRKADGPALNYSNTLTAASINFACAIVCRNEHFVNLLFWISCLSKHSWPLGVRRRFARIYTYGGVHSGCAMAGLLWYLAFTGLVIEHLHVEPLVHPAIATVTLVTVMLLLIIVMLALPSLRARMHNKFEATHRFGGWSVIALFWTQVFLQTYFTNTGSSRALLVHSPAFWCLCVISSCVIYPWTRLRMRAVRTERLSDHAIRLHFDYSQVDTCETVRLSDQPLVETHAFAAIPSARGGDGFSVLVSNAGDWTKKIINDPPSRLWSRGVPMYGVLRVAELFSPVLIIATGSGIGPCISLFNGRPKLDCRILWSTPSPYDTFGKDIVNHIYARDPRALIIDTRKTGRPDLVALAYKRYIETKAEAVLIISNPKVTRKVVYGLETRRVPIFAPIFDS